MKCDQCGSGNRNAQHNLAFFYYQGLGTSVDYKKAFVWYTKAASQGHPGAQNNLGVLYEYGYGVRKDINQAVKWYKMAADNENDDGLSNYNRCESLLEPNDYSLVTDSRRGKHVINEE